LIVVELESWKDILHMLVKNSLLTKIK